MHFYDGVERRKPVVIKFVQMVIRARFINFLSDGLLPFCIDREGIKDPEKGSRLAEHLSYIHALFA